GPWTPNDGGGFMRAILNGSETDLTPLLVHRKGKYLLYHGCADGLIGAEPTVHYYHGIVRDTCEGDTARAQENVRLFMVPEMGSLFLRGCGQVFVASAGLPGDGVYDLRLTSATQLLAHGAPITYVAAPLRHRKPTTPPAF